MIYTNRELIEGDIKAVCLRLHAYGEPDRIYEPQAADSALAGAGVLTVFPFYDVWGWGNDKTVTLIDEILSAVIEKYDLSGLPLVLFGEGVGGTVALNYARLGRHECKACLAVCPVTDLRGHARARGDMDAVLLYAFRHGKLCFDEALCAADPARNIDLMPEGVRYHIVTAGVCDERVYPHKYDRGIIAKRQYLDYAEKMRARGLELEVTELDLAFSPMSDEAHIRCAELVCRLIEGGNAR